MNEDVFKGMWKQLRGQVKQTWGKLTDDELDEIDGQRDKLIGKLQEKYGWTRMEAETQLEQLSQDADLYR
jgi:uncharacterized protein YjbJ (UPF0337 family)